MIDVLYHKNCCDGFTAAWLFGASNLLVADIDMEFHAVQYGHPPPELRPGSAVLILDFSYPRDVLERLADEGHAVVVLDHHESAQKDIDVEPRFPAPPPLGAALFNRVPPGVYVEFDMTRSGAMMALDWIRTPISKEALRTDLPELDVSIVHLVQDRDLWQWKYGDRTRGLHAWLTSGPFTFERWNYADDNLEEVIAEGNAIVRYRDQLIRDIAIPGVRVGTVEPWDHLVGAFVNGPSKLASDLCDFVLTHCKGLARPPDYAVCYSISPDGELYGSIRSRDIAVNVADIARAFGGGGHARAAGFKITTQLPRIDWCPEATDEWRELFKSNPVSTN